MSGPSSDTPSPRESSSTRRLRAQWRAERLVENVPQRRAQRAENQPQRGGQQFLPAQGKPLPIGRVPEQSDGIGVIGLAANAKSKSCGKGAGQSLAGGQSPGSRG